MENGNQILKRWNAKVRVRSDIGSYCLQKCAVCVPYSYPVFVHAVKHKHIIAAVTIMWSTTVLSRNGIIPHSNTLEGAVVTYVCWTVHETRPQCMCNEMNATAVCNDDGNWEPNSEDICTSDSDHESSDCESGINTI